MSITFLPLFFCVLGWFPQDVAQPPAARDSAGFIISTDVELVILDASVTDANGGSVSGLERDNFQVYEDKKLQNIKHLSHADNPVTIGLVVDDSGSMRSKRSEVVTAALTLVRASNPHDEVFVLNFNDKVRWGLPSTVPFTDDIQMLRDALMKGESQGRTALYDALSDSLQHLSLGRMDKKTLVVMSDGGDNASKLPWSDVLTRVQKSQATIYTIDIFDENDPDRHPDILRKLAQVSGGQYFRIEKLPEIEAVCRTIAADIRSRYTIAYAPSHLDSGPSTHIVKVTASTPSRRLIVHTRTQYASPAPTATPPEQRRSSQ
jgi:Ca-activated chloride channel family protein